MTLRGDTYFCGRCALRADWEDVARAAQGMAVSVEMILATPAPAPARPAAPAPQAGAPGAPPSPAPAPQPPPPAGRVAPLAPEAGQIPSAPADPFAP